MTLPNPISTLQVTAKEPVDELLMSSIKADLEDLDSRVQASASFDYQFKANGFFSTIADGVRRKRVDGGLISKNTTLQQCRILLEDGGLGGNIEIDILRATKPDALITAVAALYQGSIQSIGRVGSSISTQSISRATTQISTQSIARFKAQLNITSIIDLGLDSNLNHLFRINLSGAPDADWVGQSVTVASATTSGNNGAFGVYASMVDGGNNIVVINSAGAAQAGAAGTVDVDLWKFTYTNPVNNSFAAGEFAAMASHTDSNNNGNLLIYAINQGGNNIIIAKNGCVAQGGAVGNANTLRFVYTFSSAAPADYAVGETALFQSHTTGANNGQFTVKAVNSGGNNVVVLNLSGAVQAGAAGTVDTMRWACAFSTDPAPGIVAGDTVFVSGTSTSNDGTFVAKQVDRSAGTNVVVYNISGTSMGSPAGTITSAKKKISFASDQSATITTNSRIWIVNTPVVDEDDYAVLEVNRGGGSNYNAIVSTFGTVDQPGPCGRVALELKSIFDTRPKVTVPNANYGWHGTHALVSSNMVLNSTRKMIPADTLVFMDILTAPTNAKNLTVQLF